MRGSRFWPLASRLVPLALFALIGCAAGGGEGGGAVIGAKEPASVKYRVTSTLTDRPPKLVAILPFENLTDKTAEVEEETPTYVIRTAFLNRFVVKQYPTQRTAVTDRLLQEKGFVKAEEIVKLPLAKLGEITKADTVIYGQITHFNRIYAGLYAQIAVGAKLKMVDVASGEVLWETGDVQRVHSGGFATDPLGIVVTLAANAIALRHIEVVRASEELFRDLLETLPRMSTGEAVKPPIITLLVNDSSTQTKKAGDQIKVGLQGDPNMLATFDIGQYRTGIVMQEEKPGIYVGSYTVKPGDNVDNAIVMGHLADRQGLQSDWEDVVGPVTLDTMPPATPLGLATLGRDKTVSLRWKANVEKDLAGYKLYRSATALTGFAPLATVESPSYLDSKELTNKRQYFYKISAFDRVGNESPLSDATVGVPVPPGPTPVSGVIGLNTTWFAGASPYVLEGDVTVAQGAKLTVEPGTVVKSKGGGLIVRGSLAAVGTAEQMIVFTAEQETPERAWQGIRFDQTGEQESVLDRVRVAWAKVGVTCIAASPKIRASELTENGTGIVTRHASARPVIEGSQIVLNREDGISVQDASAPVMAANRIAQNRRYGVAITKAPGLSIRSNELLDNGAVQVWNASSTEAVEASGNWWGTADGAAVLAKVDGAVLVKDYLDGPLPGGKTVVLAALESELGGTITSSAFLLAAKSPYLVVKPLIVDKGATLSIQAGVVVRFKAGDTSLVVRDGAIQALGTEKRPIVLTSANASPRPGDYASAIRFEGSGQQPSLLRHVRIEYAQTALQVKEGNPEISHAFIAHNLQSALECSGKSAPKVTHSTLTEHPNNAAVICSGRAQPTLYRNNIVKNAWAVINHSSLPLEARENWWGVAQPDEGLFLGSVEFKPSLKEPDPEAVVR
ncbi:MAG: GNA1162 family protein [Nitrospirota bacterium]